MLEGESAASGISWKRVTLVLELCEAMCEHLADTHTLLPVLFSILARSVGVSCCCDVLCVAVMCFVLL